MKTGIRAIRFGQNIHIINTLVSSQQASLKATDDNLIDSKHETEAGNISEPLSSRIANLRPKPVIFSEADHY